MTFNDQELHDRFAELRREDASHVPDFAGLLRRAGKPRPLLRVGKLAAAAAFILALVAAVTLYKSNRPPAGENLSITEWQSPTDFLLQTPGREVLENVPRVGQWPGELVPSLPTATPASKKKG